MKLLPLRLSLILGLTSACVVGPDYQAPDAVLSKEWNELADGNSRVSTQSADLARWWTSFGDPLLDSLMERALAANLDLKQAAARVREARARAGVARAALRPELDLAGDAGRRRISENGSTPALGDPERDFVAAEFDASWELDLFGGRQRANEAAMAEFDASREDERAVLVSLLGEVARAYVELRGSQRSAAVARTNEAAARATLELTRQRLTAGLATELDVARAETLLANAQAPLPRFDADVRAGIHRLGVLLALEPGSLESELVSARPIPAAPATVFVGLPSELLRRRPDVRRAERRLAAANARLGVAMAERYPKFSLTGAFGLDGTNGSDLVDAASRAWTIGPVLRWPLFAGGRIRSEIEAQDARTEEALLAYRQSLLVALEEVENGLVRYLREWDHRRARTDAVAAGQRAVELVRDLHRRGLASFLEVLDAERELFDAELALAQSDTAIALNVVTLYKVGGGGWTSEG